MEKSIHIIFSEIESGFEDGEEITHVEQEDLDNLYQLVLESEKLNKDAEKFESKKEQIIRRANKLMRRIIDSHGIKYDDKTQAVGIASDDTLYIGEKQRVTDNPTGDPIDGDEIKGKITKYERRKYNELLDDFKFLNLRAAEHNNKVIKNEQHLINFEKKVLEGKVYSRENDYLIVFSKTGKVVLYRRD